MEDLVINSINARQQQLIQEQRTGGLLINLINARHRPYLLDNTHRLFTNPHGDRDPFTPE